MPIVRPSSFTQEFVKGVATELKAKFPDVVRAIQDNDESVTILDRKSFYDLQAPLRKHLLEKYCSENGMVDVALLLAAVRSEYHRQCGLEPKL